MSAHCLWFQLLWHDGLARIFQHTNTLWRRAPESLHPRLHRQYKAYHLGLFCRSSKVWNACKHGGRFKMPHPDHIDQIKEPGVETYFSYQGWKRPCLSPRWSEYQTDDSLAKMGLRSVTGTKPEIRIGWEILQRLSGCGEFLFHNDSKKRIHSLPVPDMGKKSRR